jgi:hypothetical protein
MSSTSSGGHPARRCPAVVDLLDDERLADWVPRHQAHPDPDVLGRRSELGLERVEVAEELADRGAEVAMGAPPSGLMFFQNSEWSTCPERWKARFFWSLLIAP